MTSEKYSEMQSYLVQYLIGILKDMYHLGSIDSTIWLDEDGAGPNCDILVRDFLNFLPNRWIGRSNHIECPAWSGLPKQICIHKPAYQFERR